MNTRTKWIVYGVVPLGLSLLLQAMYFSGNLVLQRLICPKLPPLNPDTYREFGLLEIIQNLLILGIIACFVTGLARARVPRLRLAYGALALFSAFVLLEETDYGTHLHAYLTADEVAGWFQSATAPEFQTLVRQIDFSEEPFNIHNQGDLTDIIKAAVTVLIFGLFIIAPLFEHRVRHPWLRYILPDRFIIVTVAVMVLTRLLTRVLSKREEDLIAAAQATGQALREAGALGNNLSEFREVLTYYLFFVYVAVVIFLRTPPAGASGSDSAARNPA